MRISDWSSDVCSSDLVIITAAAGHRTRDADSKHVVDQRHVEHRQQAAAVIVADLALDIAFEPAEIGLGGDQVNDAAGRVAAVKRPLRPAQHLDPLHVEKFLFEEAVRSEEHTSELQSLMRISYAVFCLK